MPRSFKQGDRVKVTLLEGDVYEDSVDGLVRVLVRFPDQGQDWVAVIPDSCLKLQQGADGAAS